MNVMPDIRDISNKSEVFFTWGRYLYWAELMYRNWDRYMTEKGAGAEIPERLAVSSYWASSLYVVIEGWEVAKFKDPIIDALLSIADHKDVLRRLRNGTFHYQPSLTSNKLGFLNSYHCLMWLHTVHSEFCRWLRDCIELVASLARLSGEASEEWRQGVATLAGWLPPRPAEGELEEFKKLTLQAREELEASGDDSDAARELRASLGGYDAAVIQTAENVRQVRRDLLAQVGLNPDNYVP
jgi:hypothetical protein